MQIQVLFFFKKYGIINYTAEGIFRFAVLFFGKIRIFAFIRSKNHTIPFALLSSPSRFTGRGDRSRFAQARLSGYRQNLRSCAEFERSRDIGSADGVSRRLEKCPPACGRGGWVVSGARNFAVQTQNRNNIIK